MTRLLGELMFFQLGCTEVIECNTGPVRKCLGGGREGGWVLGGGCWAGECWAGWGLEVSGRLVFRLLVFVLEPM